MTADRRAPSIAVLVLTSLFLGLLFVAAPASTACQKSPAPTATPTPTETDDGGPLPIPIPTLPGDEETPTPEPTSTSGGDRTCQAEISIAYSKSSDLFKGKVTSDDDACVEKREVKVKKVKPGKDKTVGQDNTDGGGRYAVKVPNAKGRYYAQSAAYSTEDDTGATVTCAKAKSKTIKA
jgi:hypothetical protein